jgi:soluble lytic murein transglycosylase
MVISPTGHVRIASGTSFEGRTEIISASGPSQARHYVLVWLLGAAVVALGAAGALAAAGKKHVSAHKSTTAAGKHHKRGTAPDKERRVAQPIPLPRERPAERPAATEPAVAALPPDLEKAKQAIGLVRKGKSSEATALATSIGDPVAQKLVEWALLRSDSGAGFERYAAFIRANSHWPSILLLRRRAEARLWQEHRDAATVRRFLDGEPASARGRLALARVLMGEGDHAGAEREIRVAWQSAELSAETEAAALDEFRNVLTRADHTARMDRRIGAKDFGAAMRAAKRLGSNEVAIVKACTAAEANSTKAGALLDAVSAEARRDLGYVLCRLHWLLRRDNVTGAASLVLAAPHEDLQRQDLQRQDTDEWWRERRVLARRLIDLGKPETAYRVVREAASPANRYYRAEFHFMAGWIALRFLADPATAAEHFAHVDEGSSDPIVRARAAYWRGRAAEAAGQFDEMRAQYQAAARNPTAYYGQLARARLGLEEVALRRSPAEPVHDASGELLHAADILYAIGERDLVVSFVSDLAEHGSDATALAALGELTARYNDARAMLLIGKTALARGLAVDLYAFPDIGVPSYSAIGPQVDRCIIYSIVRTESAFDQRDKSPANAVGLMQVTPQAGRDTAKRFGAVYDWKRLVSDPVYNMQMGAAEIAGLLKEYRGSYIMTFAGYNAGRGRVQQWVAQHGDPRDPKVDAVDWVERIPIAETRNYVQRVMENLLVYRARFGASIATVEPNLHRAVTVEPQAQPASVEQSTR